MSLGTQNPSALAFATSNTVRAIILPSGNVGIGTTSPSYPLHVVGNGYFTGTVTQNSDLRFKENIKPIQYGLKDILNINPVSFDWKDEERRRDDGLSEIGFIAQDFKETIPEIYHEKDDNISMDYIKLTAIMWKAIQELNNKMEVLNDRL